MNGYENRCRSRRFIFYINSGLGNLRDKDADISRFPMVYVPEHIAQGIILHQGHLGQPSTVLQWTVIGRVQLDMENKICEKKSAW